MFFLIVATATVVTAANVVVAAAPCQGSYSELFRVTGMFINITETSTSSWCDWASNTTYIV
jgi:hypothetical protein